MIQVYRNISGTETVVSRVSDRDATFVEEIMGANEIRVSVVVDAVLDITEGDYLKHDGIVYTLNRDAQFTIDSDVRYSYDLIFEHPEYTLLDKLLENKITGYTSFTLTGKLEDFVSLVVWCMNQVCSGWQVGDVIDSEFKTITITDINCREALKLFAKEFDAEYHFTGTGKTINFAEQVERTTSLVFEQGRDLGLYSITESPVDKEDTVTRVLVRGGNQNVPITSADEEGYLKLPENYLENFSEHSKVVERKVKFEEEFPRFVGSASAVSGDNNRVITCPQINFDLSAIAIGDTARINFLTGDLMGNSFEFAWDNANKRVTLVYKEDEVALPDQDGVKQTIPSSTKKAKVGDTFNFTGVIMPASYVIASINRLRSKGQKWLDYHSRKRVNFTLDIDHRWMRGKDELRAGDVVVISIPQKSYYKAIRVTKLEKQLRSNAITATVSNYLEDTWERYDAYKAGLKQDEILGFQTNVNIINGVMYRDRGPWDATTAGIKPYLRTSGIVDDVWHLGNKWRCMVNKTTVPPSFLTDHWQMIEGRSDMYMDIYSSGGVAFFGGNVNTTFTPVVYIGNVNVSDEIPEENWSWTRESGDAVRDEVWNLGHVGEREISITDVDMSPLWTKNNPIKFICTATYPNSAFNAITRTIEFPKI